MRLLTFALLLALPLAGCGDGPGNTTAEHEAPAAGDYERAAQYFDLDRTPRARRASRGPAYARELQALLDAGKVFFLDVREPKELEELGTLEGYVNIPLGQVEKRLAEIPRDKAIITA